MFHIQINQCLSKEKNMFTCDVDDVGINMRRMLYVHITIYALTPYTCEYCYINH